MRNVSVALNSTPVRAAPSMQCPARWIHWYAFFVKLLEEIIQVDAGCREIVRSNDVASEGTAQSARFQSCIRNRVIFMHSRADNK